VRNLLAEDRADHAEVGHDGDPQSRMAARERAQARPRAASELVARLAAPGAGLRAAGFEAGQPLRVAGRDLGAREPRPASEVELAQAAAAERLEPERARERPGRLERAREIARNDELEALPGELGRERRRLGPPARRERRVALALPAAGRAPARLGVADERDLRGRLRAQPVPASSRRLRAPAQAPSRRSRPGAKRLA
jgi:hypothetical protein